MSTYVVSESTRRYVVITIVQASPGLAAGATPTGCPEMANPIRPHLRHQTH